MIRTVFFGTPTFAVPFLRALRQDSEIDVALVVSQIDKPSGRQQHIQPTAVKAFAEKQGLNVFQPTQLKNHVVREHLRNAHADFFIVVAYGKLIPDSILAIPKYGCVNVHPSLLPKFRGPSPMQFAILEGVTQTGVTIMLLDEGMDTGPILSQHAFDLDPRETYSDLEKKIHDIGPSLLLKTIKDFFAGNITPRAQDDHDATLTRLLAKNDGKIDLIKETAIQVDRKIRAFERWPKVFVFWNGVRMNLIEARPTHRASTESGKLFAENKHLFIDCTDSALEILQLQPEGKKVMSAEAYIRGVKKT